MNQLFKKIFIGENKYKNYDLSLVKKMQYLPLIIMGTNLLLFMVNFSDNDYLGWLVKQRSKTIFSSFQHNTVSGFVPTTNTIDHLFFSSSSLNFGMITNTTIDTIFVSLLLIYLYLFIQVVIKSTVFDDAAIAILKTAAIIAMM